MSEPSITLAHTADIVSAYVAKNSIRADELPSLIASVNAALAGLGTPPAPVEEPVPELKPAVPIKKSVTPEYIISLEDGRRFRSLKRHLSIRGMTPDDYRAKWGLPKDYPMVAPAYAAKRAELARASGLGFRRRTDAALVSHTALTPVAAEPATLVPPGNGETAAPKRRGRPKKAM